jgi:hypothetical protein
MTRRGSRKRYFITEGTIKLLAEAFNPAKPVRQSISPVGTCAA